MIVQSQTFQRIYDPSVGQDEAWFINDHCFVLDEGGVWHMFGITDLEPIRGMDGKFFAHATSPELLAPQWQKQAHVLLVQYEEWGELHVWAPHVIKHNGTYYMYYCGGDDDHTKYKIHLATSQDLMHWERHPANPMVVDGFDARDPMILRYEEDWIMYYTATSEPSGGYHVVAAVTSKDLIHWGDKRVVFQHPKQGTYGGPTESPFVVSYRGKYYLFVCTNEPYNNTAVYESDSPFQWDIVRRVGDMPAHAAEVICTPAHAAEVICTPENEWYISRAGGGEGGLYIAPLEWIE